MSGTATALVVLDGIISGVIRMQQLREVRDRMALEGRADFNQDDLTFLASQSRQAIDGFSDAISGDTPDA